MSGALSVTVVPRSWPTSACERMVPERRVCLCFFRGLNVFGRGRISMFELERRCETAFADSGLPLRVVDYYGATGNVAILASGVPLDDIRRILYTAIPKPCAVVTLEAVEEMRRAFDAWPAPESMPGFRWTAGVSLLCDGQPGTGDLTEPDLGVFEGLNPSVVLLYRRERITERGTLDSDRRGGWGAVSNRTGTRLGGSWTARSFDVVERLLGQAQRKLSSDNRENPATS